MKPRILGLTKFFSTSDPIAPQAILKPSAILKNKFSVKFISPVPYIPFFLQKKRKYIDYYKLPKSKEIEGLEIFHTRYIEIPKNISTITTGHRYYFGMYLFLKKILKTFRPQLIHAHMAFPEGYVAYKINKLHNIPYLITFRGSDILRIKSSSNILIKLLNDIIENSSCVIFPNKRLADEAAKFLNISNYSTIPNGIDLEEYKMLDYNSNNDNFIKIISVSSLTKNKGVHLNIEAISRLKNKYNNIKYYIIGDGDYRVYLEQLVLKLELEKNVFFLGRLNRRNTLQLINDCDIFSMPSVNETFGLVYLEAMYLKKPIIWTRNDGIDGIAINEINGFHISNNDINGLVKSLEMLINDKSMRELMGMKSHELVLKEYTWQSHVEKIEHIYMGIINNNIDSTNNHN